MDQEMNFPNPVVRHDLPTRRRRWPKVLLAGLILMIVGTALLPKILSSKVGRKLVVSYISGKLKSNITLESFQTSWRGPTSIHFLAIGDSDGRSIGFKSLTCKASLLDLLRGKYRLGDDATIEGLNVDWVVDDGRGNGTWARFKGQPGEPLPIVSGNIKVLGGTIKLHRGTVQPGLYNTTWEQATLQNLAADLRIKALDQPWTFDILADPVEGVAERGNISLTGTVALAADGPPTALDATLTGENVRTGQLGAVLAPGVKPADVRDALGPVLTKIDVVAKKSEVGVAFERFDMIGPGSQVKLKPTLDFSATPDVLGMAGPGAITLANSKRLGAGLLVYANPFFREMAGGGASAAGGQVTIAIDELRLPLDRTALRTVAAKGKVIAKAVALDRKDEMTAAQVLPDNVASQLALLTGDANKASTLEGETAFSISEGNVIVPGAVTTIGDAQLGIEGTTEMETGTLKMTATIVKAPTITSLFQAAPPAAPVGIPITGTIRQPQLGVLNLKGDLPNASLKLVNDRVNEQITRMRAKETQRLMQKSQNTVQEILRPLQDPTEKK